MPGISKTQRWLDLIAFLVGRRFPVAYDQIMEAVPAFARELSDGADPESVRRKFERDKDELRELGIPLETVKYSVDGVPSQGYRLRSEDFYLPYLRLLGADDEAPAAQRAAPARAFDIEPEELQAAAEGLHALADLDSFPLRAEARSALRKVTFDLPQVRETVAVPYLAAADGPDTREIVALLSDAVARRRRITFRYHSIGRDQVRDRRVRPYGLLFKYNRWYLVGWDEDREALRTFRASRMAEVKMDPRGGTAPDFDVPEDFDLGAWSDRQPWDLPGDDGEPLRVVVRFDFPRSLWAERNGQGEAVGEPDEAGARMRAFTVRQEDPFLRWLLTFEGDARVMEPPGLAARFHRLAAGVARLYSKPGPDA